MNHAGADLIEQAVDKINQLSFDARVGLPEPLFLLVSRLTPMVNVELLVTNSSGEKLLTWREDRFYGPGWHIPGGIVRFKETMSERVEKVAHSEIGTPVEIVGECLRVSEIQHKERDIRGHFISHVFKCRLLDELNESRRADLNAPKHGQWAWFAKTPEQIIPQHQRFSDLIDAVRL